ncbi:MAG TPA: type II CAAX endopeptidase family protein [Dyella sp.]|uniref:CPBP family intramembrane glutamic endopeptidase n=1 Tax=Dyella sp. TaxID=1869338 RepID=UPI002D77FFF0|nr:type II CAAX endopeptidase family protein [Dyella sp.]HET6554007.1 type II CAAX endopeptidase family protein [Dyella sp.]
MDANPLKYATVSPPSEPLPSTAPRVVHALWLIALYFALQVSVGGLISLAAGLYAVVHDGQGIANVIHQTRVWLNQPDASAIAVMMTLLISAMVMVYLIRRWWPALWSMPNLPGLGFAPARPVLIYGVALVLGILMPIVGGMLTQWLAHGHEVSQDIKQLGSHISLPLRLPLALLVVSIGPLVEELLFRGVLLSAIARHLGSSWAIVLSAALFACVHLPDLSFLWYALPNLALLGLVLGWLRVQSGSIWPSVFSHGVNNLLAVVSWFVMTPGN